MPPVDEAEHMTPAPAVRCTACHFSWNSATMAEGLRLLGSCLKCGGVLEFRDGDGGTAERFDRGDEQRAAADKAPHLVLGIPRR